MACHYWAYTTWYVTILRPPRVKAHEQQAHALTPLLTEQDPPSFPFLVVLVSGGHTQLVLAKSFHEYSIIADCLDSKIG